jgi:serine phosphatase RsbU (regulator of sigma subunit)/HAMP domain-containing protein
MRFTIGKKIGLGFSIVLLLLLTIFVFTLFVVDEAENTLDTSIELNNTFIDVDQPTVSKLNHLNENLAKTQILIRKWITDQSYNEAPFKIAALNLIKDSIPSDTIYINALADKWSNNNKDKDLYNSIKKDINELLKGYNSHVISIIVGWDSYGDGTSLISSTFFDLDVEPLYQVITNSLNELLNNRERVAQIQQEKSTKSFKHTNENFTLLSKGILLAGLILLAATLIIAIFTTLSITRPVYQLKTMLIELGRGVFPKTEITPSNDEIGEMATAMNNLVGGLKKTTKFAHEVGQSNFEHPYKPLSDDDTLGHALLKMKDELAETERILEQKVKERTEEVVRQKDEIDGQKSKLEELYKDVTDSIKYAKRLQDSILPPTEYMTQLFPNSFVLFKPKDIVSGDFYWMHKVGKKHLFAAVDCTGHGVPGAFMSLVGANGLNSAVKEHELDNPGEILDDLNKYAHEALNKDSEDNTVRDGMDIALCSIDYDTMELEFSGAYNPLYLIRDGEILITKSDKFAIGSFSPNEKNYDTKNIPIKKGDIIYVFSDGYPDQFGGLKGKKFLYRQFRETLISIKDLPMQEQQQLLDQKIETWKGSYEQVDDILIIGVRID